MFQTIWKDIWNKSENRKLKISGLKRTLRPYQETGVMFINDKKR